MRLTRLIEEVEEGRSADLTTLLGIQYDHEMAQTWGYFYESYGNRVFHLETIRTSRKARRGTGTAIMEELCDIADREGFIISLSLATKGDFRGSDKWKSTTSTGRLERWYRSFGFKRKASSGRYDLRGHMMRSPR